MSTHKLTFNILTFTHPSSELTFHFFNQERQGLHRFYKTLVPDEVIQHFGEQDNYYTSFDLPLDDSFSITKLTSPEYTESVNKNGETVKTKVDNSCFGISILKRYYNYKIHSYFKEKGCLVKPNFIDDTEVWLPSEKAPNVLYNFYDKYSLRIQIARVSELPELVISFEGTSKVFNKSLQTLSAEIPPEAYTWIIHNNNLFRHNQQPEEARRYPENAFPVWNFKIRSALNQTPEAPERGNKYLKYNSNIAKLFAEHINTDEFKTIIPINCDSFIAVPQIKIGQVSNSSNKLLFGKKNGVNGTDISPITGMSQYGPLSISKFSNIHLFFIFHKDDLEKAEHIQKYFNGELFGFKGLQQYAHLKCFIVPKFSIVFHDNNNPLPEIESKILKREFKSNVRYIAVYISPISKNVSDIKRISVYYKIKELLLKYRVTSQVLDSEKILDPKIKYHYSLPNIAIAMLAKLNGIPWRLDTQTKNELIVGVGAFRHKSFNVQYIGSAFSFQNNGTFNSFECFRKNEIDELAGSILSAVKDYAIHNTNIKRLIIHFYKSMSQRELQPIEDGLKNLGLDIPVFIVTINKTESRDIVAFDDAYQQKMPLSGLYIKIGFNKYLLFNNTRYNNQPIKGIAGYPFPVKLAITCTHKKLENDPKIIRELLDQVYQFSRVYWKSLSQQNLPVTIKYPEMVAEMFPYFDGYEIPDFGKDNLWFL